MIFNNKIATSALLLFWLPAFTGMTGLCVKDSKCVIAKEQSDCGNPVKTAETVRKLNNVKAGLLRHSNE